MKACNDLSSTHEIAVRDALMKVTDPEIGENIVDLGLVYGIEVQEKSIRINMTMTSPACPMGEMLLEEVQAEMMHAFPDSEINIQLVWEPPWDPEMMSADAKAGLGWE
ncbi:Fe-S protein maturation auxiliary factor SufT [Methylophilaceae bacterium]|nr:Fe-S protein maturation auxiliary factor SufT [Methylophilaceae bacterium]